VSLTSVVVDNPHLVCLELLGGRMIVEGGSDNETHCLCFTCIAKMNKTTVPVGASLLTADKENVIALPNASNNLIEKCSWDDIIVTKNHTNAVRWTQKGEPLKSKNSTHLQGFCVDGVIIPTEKIAPKEMRLGGYGDFLFL
jgi:hypothetical protein